MLTDAEILKNMKSGEITISPFKRLNLGANSYDLRIGDRIRSLKYNNAKITIDLTAENQYNFYDIDLPYMLLPKELIIFTSKEVVGCRCETLGLLSPRSNLSRSGLIFQFSQLLDTGFKGIVSGVIYNPMDASFWIPKNLRVMQIMFTRVPGEFFKRYNERKWSKNTNQFKIEDIKYKPDKEWRRADAKL